MNRKYNPFSERNLHSSYNFKRRNNNKLFFFIIAIIITLFLYTNYKEEILTNVKSINETFLTKVKSINKIVNENMNSLKTNYDIQRNETFIEQRILELVNEERTRVGVRQLAPANHLNQLAKKHSIKMMEEGFFEHSNGLINCYFGENIARIPIYSNVEDCGTVYTNEQMARCMVDSWIDSPEHYSNIIEDNYLLTGIGISCNEFKCDGTQNFYNPLF